MNLISALIAKGGKCVELLESPKFAPQFCGFSDSILHPAIYYLTIATITISMMDIKEWEDYITKVQKYILITNTHATVAGIYVVM